MPTDPIELPPEVGITMRQFLAVDWLLLMALAVLASILVRP
jgi:hypothetical protein